jgi:DNA-directed RNA polymerase subunit omega
MARAHDSMVNPPIENLLDRVDSKFALVTMAARRARQINSYLSIGFEEIAADKIIVRPIVVAEPAEGDAPVAAVEA